MKFKIVRSRFIESLKVVQNIVPSKGSLAILQNVLIEAKDGALNLMTTDLDISICSKVSCDILEEGSTTLPVKLLFNAMVKAPEGEVVVETNENEMAVVSAGSSRLRLNGKAAANFPKFEEEAESTQYKMPRETLFEMIRKTAYAASQDDTRRTLKGVLMSFKESKLTMVATDGRRLAMVENEMEFPVNFERDIVLPSKTVQELQRCLPGKGDITISAQETKISFEMDDIKVYSKLVADTYPNYRQVIPNECKEKVSVNRTDLLSALERASVMTMDEAHSIKLIFDTNTLTVTSAVSEVGEAKDEVPIKYAGEKIEIIFNPSYVMDPLRAIDDDEIYIHINNGHTPAIIRCSIPFLYVLMPLRINN